MTTNKSLTVVYPNIPRCLMLHLFAAILMGMDVYRVTPTIAYGKAILPQHMKCLKEFFRESRSMPTRSFHQNKDIQNAK